MKDDKSYYKSERFAELQQQWFGWGSPVGLTLFFVGLAFAFWLVAQGFSVITSL